jgi:hypothetical protein
MGTFWMWFWRPVADLLGSIAVLTIMWALVGGLWMGLKMLLTLARMLVG